MTLASKVQAISFGLKDFGLKFDYIADIQSLLAKCTAVYIPSMAFLMCAVLISG